MNNMVPIAKGADPLTLIIEDEAVKAIQRLTSELTPEIVELLVKNSVSLWDLPVQLIWF